MSKGDKSNTDFLTELEGILPLESKSEFFDVLSQLISADENTDLKTEIHKPRILTIFTILVDFCNQLGLSYSAHTLKQFIKYYLRYMISYQRKSREEIVNALQSLREYEKEQLQVAQNMPEKVLK